MATETTETAVGACVDAGGSALGMPQLCADWMGNQVAWLVVVKSVTAVAKDTAKELVAALGGSADAKTITAAVTARMKG